MNTDRTLPVRFEAVLKAPQLRQTFASLGNANFRLFWTGQSVSLIGRWMQILGQSWLVLQLTHSAIALGFVSALQFTPILLASLFAGVLIDRFPKHKLLLVTQCALLLQASAMAFLTMSGRIEVWHIYVLAVVLGLLNAFDQPGRQAFVAELVGRGHLVNAVSLNSAQVNCAKLVGPAIGGLVIVQWGVGTCFALYAVGSLATVVSLLLLMRRRIFRPVPKLSHSRPVLAEVGEGLRFLLSKPNLATAIILLLGLGPFIYSTSSIIPLIAQDALHVGAKEFGLMVAAVGLGSLAVSLTIATRASSTEAAILRSAAAFGVLYMALAFVPSFPLALIVLVLLGWALQGFGTMTTSLMQLGSPPEMRGRALSVFTLLTNGMQPLGALFMGFMADRQGIRFTVAVEAGISLLALACALIYRARVNAAPQAVLV